jgi:hypothetical protein
MAQLQVFAVAAGLAGVAFLIRTIVHVGRRPGGVDTWYHLAYAEAFRRHPSLDVRLPQYLLQDPRQSYPPLFPSLLALLPARWLDRHYWVVSPVVDCVHLLLLYAVTYRLTNSIAVGAIAAATYAFTPHLISETRSLSPRPFGALLHTVAVLVLFKWLASGEIRWALAAAFVGALLFLSSAALAAAYGFVCACLSVVFGDPRYVLCSISALLAAFVFSGGHMARVVRNYWHAVAYWRRCRRSYGAHPVRNSPLYGEVMSNPAQSPGFLGRNVLLQQVRLLGENPFLIALPLAAQAPAGWGRRLYAWALALAVLSIVATAVPLLRAFGPGRSYMKAAIFPMAFCLAYGIGGISGLRRPLGMVVVACLGASLAAILFFVVYVRRRPTEQTAALPAGLVELTAALAALPVGGVFVLPYMYADSVCYGSGKPVVWGGHCGDLRRFEWVAPVITRPLPELFGELGVRYLLLDSRYARIGELQLGGWTSLIRSAHGFELHGYSRRATVGEPPERST